MQDLALVLRGTVVTAQRDRSLLVLEDTLIGASATCSFFPVRRTDPVTAPPPLSVVDVRGFISHLEPAASRASQKLLDRVGRDVPRDHFIEIGQDGWILPGFVDTHSE